MSKIASGVSPSSMLPRPSFVGPVVVIACLLMGFWNVQRVLAQVSAPTTPPTTTAAPKLEIVTSDKTQQYKLTRTHSSETCFSVRNVSGGDLAPTSMSFGFDPDASGAKVDLPVPVVKGWIGTTLKDKETTELCIWFPAYEKLGDHPGKLYALFLGETSPGEKFADVKVSIVEPAVPGISKLWATIWAAIVAVLVFVLAFFVRRKANRSFLQSPDGDYSVSRFQVMAWTIVIISSYAYLYLVTGAPVSFPDSVWYLMGISVGSLSGAKILATTQSQSLGGGVAPGGAGGGGPKPLGQAIASMLADDDHQPSTMRYQMFVWTIITAVFFLRQVWATNTLWDVPSGLLVLMGISHGGYLLDKGVSADTSMKAQSLQPSKVAHDPGTNRNLAAQLVIVGLNFSPTPGTATVMLGGQNLAVANATETRLTVPLPANQFAVGQYDLVVQQPGQDAEVVKNAFEVQ